MNFKTLFTSIIVFIPLLGYSQAPDAFEISKIMNGEPLGLHMEIYEDQSNNLSFNEILLLSKQGKFIPSNQKVPNFGLNPSAQWAKFSLFNPYQEAVDIFLENSFSFTDRFSLFYKDIDGNWLSKTGGDQLDFDKRDVNSRQVVFKLSIPPGMNDFIVKTSTIGTLQLPLKIWTPDKFHAANAVEYNFIGILIGIHVVIALYNLFLFLSLRDSTYLSYVFYVLSNLLYQCSGLGLIQQTTSAISVSQTIPNELMIIAVDLCAIASLLFSMQFLNLKKHIPKLHYAFQFAIAISIINIVITLSISVKIGTSVCFYTASQATSLLLLAGFLSTKQGYPPAKYYLAAWACYLLGVTGTLFNLLGLAPTNLFTKWGQFTGGAIEVAILSLALGSRINEKKRKQVHKINELNRTLETKVEMRTAEIKSLLILYHKEFSLLARIPKLSRTTLHSFLRSYFKQRLLTKILCL